MQKDSRCVCVEGEVLRELDDHDDDDSYMIKRKVTARLRVVGISGQSCKTKLEYRLKHTGPSIAFVPLKLIYTGSVGSTAMGCLAAPSFISSLCFSNLEKNGSSEGVEGP